jgi:hypothetical protein
MLQERSYKTFNLLFKGFQDVSLGCGNSLVGTLWGHHKIYVPKIQKLSSCLDDPTMFHTGAKKHSPDVTRTGHTLYG